MRGVVLGNIHLEEIRDWYGARLSTHGLEHVEPLWADPPGRLVREVVDLGYRAVVVSVMLEVGNPEWVGRALDRPLVEEIEAFGADACGERGERPPLHGARRALIGRPALAPPAPVPHEWAFTARTEERG